MGMFNRWRGSQWIDKYGRTWFEDARGMWWRDNLSISGMLTFVPSRRRPPREYGPYAIAETEIHPRGITELCPQTSWMWGARD